MKWSRSDSLVWSLGMLCMCAGCSGWWSFSPAGAGGRTEYTSDELPALGEAIQVDQGRLSVAPPRNWHAMPTATSDLASFDRYTPAELPSMQISVEATGDSLPEADDAKKMQAYATAVANYLATHLESGEKLLQEVEPHLLGGRVWARYVLAGMRGAHAIDRQCLVTTQAGRTYCVELQTVRGKQLRYRADAYAVAAGAQFHQTTDESPSTGDEATNHAEAVETPAAADAGDDSAENRADALDGLFSG